MQSNPNPNVKIQALIELLTAENADDAAHRRRLAELADYRNYFRFSIDICDPKDSNRKISDLDHRRGKASGGQKFIPFYICLGVAAQSAYFNHLGGSKDAPPQSALLLMDEAFEKLDPDNIQKVIQFYKSLGLQLIMAAPKTHQAIYQENFDTFNPMHKPRSYFEERAKREA